MELIELPESGHDEYNHFVAAQNSGSFLQSWEWGEWQKSLGRQVMRFSVLNDGSKIASIQLIRMPLPLGRHYWYAPYGPIISEKFKVESEKLLQQLQEKFSDAVFIRIESKDNPQPATRNPAYAKASAGRPQLTKTTNIQPAKSLIIALSKPTDQLLAEMHPKTRYNIKVAQRHGCEIKDEFDISIGHGLFTKEAVELLAATAHRQGYRGYGADYYNKLINFFAVQNREDLGLHIYKAVYQNQLLASAVMLDFGPTRTFLFGGSSDVNKNIMAPYLLHWQAMLDAKTAGLLFYDFWGVETSSGEVPGFVRFKLGFGGETKIYSGAYDLVNKKAVYALYATLRGLRKTIGKISF